MLKNTLYKSYDYNLKTNNISIAKKNSFKHAIDRKIMNT